MPVFAAPSFAINIPADAKEASSYCFALPSDERFSPSVVVKWQNTGPGVRLKEYVEQQLQKMAETLEAFKLIAAPASPETPNEVRMEYEWGDGERRFRQTQLYVVSGTRIYTLTGTTPAAKHAKYRDQVESVLASFDPKN